MFTQPNLLAGKGRMGRMISSSGVFPNDNPLLTFYGSIPAIFSGDSFGITEELYDLSAYAGQSVRFRFHMSSDSFFAFVGWRIDDFRVFTCGTSEVVNLLTNGDFDDEGSIVDGVPGGWQRGGNTGGNDKVKCNPDKTFWRSTPCAYKFKGNTGENSKIKQTLDAADLSALSVTPLVGDTFTFDVYVRSNNANGKAMVKVKYTDETSAPKQKVDLTSSATYALFTGEATVDSAAVDSVTVQVKSKATTGKTFVDDAALYHEAGAAPRGSGTVLPPPPAPDGFHGGN